MSFYRALLRLYPRSFRADYADELARTFTERQGHRGWVAAHLAALVDVIPNALAAHWTLLRQDLAYTARSLRNAPGFAVTAILVVALGVGANTAAFSVADFVFLRPFPFHEPDRLVKIYEGEKDNAGNYGDMSPANFLDVLPRQRSFDALGVFTFGSANMVSASDPRRIDMIRTTAQVLPLLGVRPILGGLFAAEDTVTGQAIVLGHALWQSQFGGDPAIVGTHVRLNGIPHVVRGVMPPWFRFPGPNIEAWAPLTFDPANIEDRTNRYVFGIGRLRDGVTREMARQDLDAIYAGLEQQYPMANHRTRTVLFDLRGEISPRSRMLVLALVGASLCILLLACANLASLFLVRGSHRARELAVRAALGAGRERLVRQLITESLVVAVAGGVVGIALAGATVPLLGRLVPGGLPVASQPTLDARIIAFALVLVVLTGLAFGIAPAIRAGGSSAIDALRGGARAGGRTQRIRAALVIVEVASSVVLLVASGLLIRTIWRVQSVDPGFVATDVLAARTALPLPKYDSTGRRMQFYERVLDDVRALPGVEAAAYVTGLPLEMRGRIRSVTIPGREIPRGSEPTLSYRFASDQYFATMGIPLRQGRDFADSDTRDGLRVAIVSASFAQEFFAGDAVGKVITVNDSAHTIVGVVGDVRVRGLERPSEAQLYVHAAQVPDGAITGYIPQELVVRARNATTLVPRIREIVRAADPEQPVSNVRLLSDVVSGETASRVTQVRVLAVLSALALLIAGLGIHGLLAFAVSKRSQELGVRRALGAQASGIVGLVVREGVVLAGVGVAIGVPIAWVAARGMSAALFDVSPEDPTVLALAATLCLVTAIAGCLRPAARAARVDPLTALRSD